jgi:uncharacterized caspase-like protein
MQGTDHMNEERPEEKRRAVVIGINKYEDTNIEALHGAENDATEIHQRLKDANIGNFEILDEHFLRGEEAKCANVRKAISDVLWKTSPADLVLFYFSGHGFVDGYGNGYIAPYDMKRNEPFVSGIKMQELRDIISKAVDKKTVFMIFDCCYAGIATKGEDKTEFEKNLDLEGEGRITLASSEDVATSREIRDCIHQSNNNPHQHGLFTYHLIEGLDGKAAADNPNGIISIDAICKYVEKEMEKNGKKAKFKVSGGSLIDRIKIAIVPDVWIKNRDALVEQINTDSKVDDITTLYTTAIKINNELLAIDPNNKKIIGFKGDITNCLQSYKGKIKSWLDANQMRVRPKLKKPMLYGQLYDFENSLNFNSLVSMDPVKLAYLQALFDTMNGASIESFIDRVQPKSSESSRLSGGS